MAKGGHWCISPETLSDFHPRRRLTHDVLYLFFGELNVLWNFLSSVDTKSYSSYILNDNKMQFLYQENVFVKKLSVTYIFAPGSTNQCLSTMYAPIIRQLIRWPCPVNDIHWKPVRYFHYFDNLYLLLRCVFFWLQDTFINKSLSAIMIYIKNLLTCVVNMCHVRTSSYPPVAVLLLKPFSLDIHIRKWIALYIKQRC